VPSEGLAAPLEGPIIQGVWLVDQLTRGEVLPFRASSGPGHTIHVVTSGRAEQRVNGVRQAFGPGTTVWYYEDEEVEGRILKAPWTFITIGFAAPTIMPPPSERRVQPASQELVRRAETLLQVWRDAEAAPLTRHIRVHALLLEILVEVLPESAHAYRADSPTRLWWDIEAKLRADLSQPISMAILQKIGRRSQQRITGSCWLAVGMTPMKRMKHVRLSYARGLVQSSNLSMSEIAYRVGYTRVQEFSRDFRRHFGLTPSQTRERGPQYRELELPGLGPIPASSASDSSSGASRGRRNGQGR
jgi:AraC-like DNA-binding protein